MRVLLLAVLFAAVVNSACSGVDGGVRAYESGNYPAVHIEFRPLAEEGYRLAQYTLGLMYAQGQGVPQNYVEASKWFGRAATQGAPQAQFELGMLYARGRGVPQDFVLAHAWINLAAATADPADVPYYSRERNALSVLMTPEQLATAQRLARESANGVFPGHRR